MTTGSSDATRAALLVAAGAAVGAAVGAHVRVSSWCPAMPWGKKSARAGSTANARASKEELIANLGLIPHPEGGFFCETYRSGCAPMASKGLTDLMGNMMTTTRGPTPERNVMTSIYYMLTPEHDFQAWVVNASDHVHYHHAGGTFVYHIVSPNGTYYTRRCGGVRRERGRAAGCRPRRVVQSRSPRGRVRVWDHRRGRRPGVRLPGF